MACIRNCRLCPRFIISQDVTFADNQLQVNLPAGSYADDNRYCVVIAQSIPDTTTINSEVVFTIGDDATTTYPFVTYNGLPITASQIRTRTIYPVRVQTGPTTGVFTYIGNRCLPSNSTTNIQALPIPAVTVQTITDETANGVASMTKAGGK